MKKTVKEIGINRTFNTGNYSSLKMNITSEFSAKITGTQAIKEYADLASVITHAKIVLDTLDVEIDEELIASVVKEIEVKRVKSFL